MLRNAIALLASSGSFNVNWLAEIIAIYIVIYRFRQRTLYIYIYLLSFEIEILRVFGYVPFCKNGKFGLLRGNSVSICVACRLWRNKLEVAFIKTYLSICRAGESLT